ncbi:Aminopeptidase S (Leu, Val, Phe, Tyr preference) [Clostridiaceae bacterium JG1575]|nr:Aminopeptidase S (Leu, Val, Phe, Tyr preference) [Clostridiaceae bacterium JG1575]
MDQQKLAQYAKVIAKVGVNAQPGDGFFITFNADGLPLVRLVAKELYSLGAKNVVLRFQDNEVTLARFTQGRDEIFDEYPAFEVDYLEAMYQENYHRIAIVSPDPELMKDVDRDRARRAQTAALDATERLDKYMDSGRLKWVVAACPSPQWARIVFPDLSVEEAMEALWEKIFQATYMNAKDPVQVWTDHEKDLKQKEQWLDAQQFESLHYEGPGTDFTVHLAQDHKWVGGASVTPDGVSYMANIPTEEIFTTPHKTKADGTLRATKPLAVQGHIVEDFSFVFQDGKVVGFEAAKNADILEQMMDMDEGGRYLGEVALVSHSSPISQSGILFSNTLFDENASCHFALGNSYAETLINGERLSQEERTLLGANHSRIHIDFMVGGPSLNVTGRRADGTLVPILEGGEWSSQIR